MDGVPIRKGNSGRGGVKSRGNPAAGFCRPRPDVRVDERLAMRGPRIRGVGKYFWFQIETLKFPSIAIIGIIKRVSKKDNGLWYTSRLLACTAGRNHASVCCFRLVAPEILARSE